MTDLLRVEGLPALRKDARSGAVINTDREALLEARRIRDQKLKEREHITKLEEKVDRLEALLNKLLEGKIDGQ